MINMFTIAGLIAGEVRSESVETPTSPSRIQSLRNDVAGLLVVVGSMTMTREASGPLYD